MSAADLTAAGLGLWQPEGPSASYDLSWQKETNADSHVRRDTAIFIDHTSTVLGFEQFCKEHDLPNSARIDFESFAHFLQESTTEPLDVSTRRIAASAPLEERHREELTVRIPCGDVGRAVTHRAVYDRTRNTRLTVLKGSYSAKARR